MLFNWWCKFQSVCKLIDVLLFFRWCQFQPFPQGPISSSFFLSSSLQFTYFFNTFTMFTSWLRQKTILWSTNYGPIAFDERVTILASTHLVTALWVCVCCIIFAWGSHIIIMQSHTHTMQHTHKAGALNPKNYSLVEGNWTINESTTVTVNLIFSYVILTEPTDLILTLILWNYFWPPKKWAVLCSRIIDKYFDQQQDCNIKHYRSDAHTKYLYDHYFKK